MKKILLLLPCLSAIFSCTTEETDMSIELASPKLTVTTRLASATISWDPVQKADGYAYRIDDGQENLVASDVTSITVEDLTKGEHTAYVWSTGDEVHTTNSLERSTTFTIDPKLQTPQPSYEISEDMQSVTFTWEAVDGASGYVYRIGEGEEKTVGSDVTSVTESNLEAGVTYTFTMHATGEGNIEDSDAAMLSFSIVDVSQGVWARFTDGTTLQLTEQSTGIWTATADCAAQSEFTIVKDGTVYGFTTWSGNGGIGTVNSQASAVPFYTYPSAVYYVRQSLGQMTAGETENDVNRRPVGCPRAVLRPDGIRRRLDTDRQRKQKRQEARKLIHRKCRRYRTWRHRRVIHDLRLQHSQRRDCFPAVSRKPRAYRLGPVILL